MIAHVTSAAAPHCMLYRICYILHQLEKSGHGCRDSLRSSGCRVVQHSILCSNLSMATSADLNESSETIRTREAIDPQVNDPSSNAEEEIDTVMAGWTTRPPNWRPHFTDEGYCKIAQLTEELSSKGIHCCLVDTEALHYYAAPYLFQNFQLCVSSVNFDDTIKCVSEGSPLAEEFERVPSIDPTPSWDPNPRNPIDKFARFEHKTHALTVYIVPAATICLESVFDQPDRDLVFEPKKKVFFPALKNLIQASLDFPFMDNLEALVDSMDLTDDWAAEAGINFEDSPGEKISNGLPAQRRKTWLVTLAGKKRRISCKVDPRHYATQFRKIGHADMTKKIRCVGG